MQVSFLLEFSYLVKNRCRLAWTYACQERDFSERREEGKVLVVVCVKVYALHMNRGFHLGDQNPFPLNTLSDGNRWK